MWLGDRTYFYCPTCAAWGYVHIVSVDALYTDRRLGIRCARGHRTAHEVNASEMLHLNPPQPPQPLSPTTVMRGPSEHGPWTHSAVVKDYGVGQRVIDRWRREHPEAYCAIAIGEHVVMVAWPRGAPDHRDTVQGPWKSESDCPTCAPATVGCWPLPVP